ncbi:potassium transporter Trk [Halobiforma lacisalsi AJ5]|uniref:Potassium transporter Trk n=2 Tax=Natronobacterium lacisalsi TaxID=229731 RepID=M0LJ98_NATLA|nr:TrkH family potassium uptake protein [Halobiforma lacisalsi]APW96648.1 potassium transporter Trk [Halobiforma lacisalsi AJ5]EMA32070.1 trk system potassium uptake protein TrkH [Halobiforma lacisalsi AJ5]
MQYRTVGRDLGRILQIVSLMLLVSVLIAAINGELYAIPAFVASAIVVGGLGLGLARRYRSAPEPGKLEAMVTAATAWGAVGLLGSLPFLFVAWTIALDPYPAWANTPAMTDTVAVFLRPVHGVFESISGFTSTGLTMAVVEEELPRSIHWWRSFTEWIGGVGVIVLTVAILARPGSGSLTLFESEARSEKIHPSIVSTVTEIWKIYLGFTLAGIVLFLVAGMPPWDALNHAMTGISTGGFSVHADSIGHYGSPAIEYAVIPVMVAGSIAFPIHYLILKGEVSNFYRDIQTRWVFVWFTAGSLLLTGLLAVNGQYDTLEETFRIGLFQFVSATSNAGFGTATLGGGTERVWTAGPTFLLCLGMLTGAAAGSTVGGLKLVRVLVLLKGTVWQIRSVFVPETAVRHLRLGARSLDKTQVEREYTEAAVVFVLWILFLMLGVAVFLWTLPPSYPAEYVIFDVMSAQSTVGLDTGITGPDMPEAAKVVLIFNMWVGRLEIIPVAVLLGTVLERLNLYR